MSIGASKANSPQSEFQCLVFNSQYPHFFSRSFSSFLRLLPRRSVTSIHPSIFPSLTCFRRQFLRKMWPVNSTFILFITCRKWTSSLTLSDISSFLSRSVQLVFLCPSPTTYFKTSQLYLIYFLIFTYKIHIKSLLISFRIINLKHKVM